MHIEYRIAVQYGTQRDRTYAIVPSLDSARKLKRCAIELGYRDATIHEVQVEDRHWKAPRDVVEAEEAD